MIGTRDELTRYKDGVRRGGLVAQIIEVHYNLLTVIYCLHVISRISFTVVFRLLVFIIVDFSLARSLFCVLKKLNFVVDTKEFYNDTT